jgi:copper chaperone CopZ
MVKKAYSVKGMTCNGCRTKVEATLREVDGVESATVTLEPAEAILVTEENMATETLNAALADAGNYHISELERQDPAASAKESAPAPAAQLPEKNLTTYKPLLVVVGFILMATAISQINRGAFDSMDAMRVFMGSFFLAFSFFKILDVKGFAYAYTSYDIIANRWLGWGYIYPFIELALGISYLTGFQPAATYAVTLVVMGVSTIGVVQSVVNKKQIKCACLGTGFNLPMSTVTIVEDVTMVVMAAAMLLFG